MPRTTTLMTILVTSPYRRFSHTRGRANGPRNNRDSPILPLPRNPFLGWEGGRTRVAPSTNSIQYRHLMASACIISAQKGHLFELALATPAAQSCPGTPSSTVSYLSVTVSTHGVIGSLLGLLNLFFSHTLQAGTVDPFSINCYLYCRSATLDVSQRTGHTTWHGACG